MRYLALATDYDGTVAQDGRLDAPTLEALERLRKSGRRLVLVTGRELDELLEVCPEIGIFDRVVAEGKPLSYRWSDGPMSRSSPTVRRKSIALLGCPPRSVERSRRMWR